MRTEHFDVFYCRGIKQPLNEIWPTLKNWKSTAWKSRERFGWRYLQGNYSYCSSKRIRTAKPPHEQCSCGLSE
jgi:hypothetical protein